MGVKKNNSVQGVGGAAAGGGYRVGPHIEKMGVNFFFLQLSRGPEGPSRWPKATSPPQELEVGTRRAPYIYFEQNKQIEEIRIRLLHMMLS